jgi:hypothetical protein
MAIITMAIVIGVVGGTKLYLGVTRSRPILFLVILLIISLIALYTKKKAYQLILVLLTP